MLRHAAVQDRRGPRLSKRHAERPHTAQRTARALRPCATRLGYSPLVARSPAFRSIAPRDARVSTILSLWCLLYRRSVLLLCCMILSGFDRARRLPADRSREPKTRSDRLHTTWVSARPRRPGASAARRCVVARVARVRRVSRTFLISRSLLLSVLPQPCYCDADTDNNAVPSTPTQAAHRKYTTRRRDPAYADKLPLAQAASPRTITAQRNAERTRSTSSIS
jgi:hypothetical protein